MRDIVFIQYLADFLKAFIALLKLYAAAASSTFTVSPLTPYKSCGLIGNLTSSDLLLVLHLYVCRRAYVFSTSESGCLISWGYQES